MDLRQVEYVLAVVEHGGFTNAARALRIAQPSLSQGVRKLEDELGTALFDRTGRAVRLTEAGRAFVAPARQLLRDAAIARASVVPFTTHDAGTLDIVALPTLVADPLAPLVGAYRRAFPRIVVRVAEPESQHDLLRMVRDGTSDVGLAELGTQTSGLARTRLGRQELLAVCPPGTDLPPGERFSLRALAGEPVITSPPGTSTRDLVDRAFATVGATPQVAVETVQREAIVPLVVAGAGIAFLPPALATEAVARGAVAAPTTPALARVIGLVHRPGPMSPAADAFVRTARSSVAPAGRRGAASPPRAATPGRAPAGGRRASR